MYYNIFIYVMKRKIRIEHRTQKFLINTLISITLNLPHNISGLSNFYIQHYPFSGEEKIKAICYLCKSGDIHKRNIRLGTEIIGN